MCPGARHLFVKAFLDDAEARLDAIDELVPEERSPEAEEAWQKQRQDLAAALYAQLALLLAESAG